MKVSRRRHDLPLGRLVGAGTRSGTRFLAVSLTVLLGGLLTAGSVGAEPVAGEAWRDLPGGLSLRTHRAAEGAPGPAWVVLLRLDPALHRLRILTAPAAETGPFGAERAARESGALAAINGGFFDESGEAIGWVVSDGRELSQLKTRGWGVFVVDSAGRPHVYHASRVPELSAREAVQAGPRLVVRGAVNSLKRQSARRSFVGIDGRGRIVLGSTVPRSADAEELAKFLAAPEKDGGAGLVDALALDGGSSAQLFVKGAGVDGADLSTPAWVGVPNVLAVLPIEPTPASAEQ